MAEDRPAWQEEIRALRSSLEALEGRVRHLEAGSAAVVAGEAPGAERDDQFEQAVRSALAKTPPLAGRLLLVLGGAYLLRALTGVEQVAVEVGATAGLAYGLIWLILADRAGRTGAKPAACWHGAATALIVFPLLWETSVRFGVLPFGAAAALLVACTLAAFWVASRRGLPALATQFSAASGISALALMLAHADAALPATAALIMLGWVTLHLGRRRGLRSAMAISAGAADCAAIVLAIVAVRGSVAGPLAITLSVLLFVSYVGVSVTECLSGRRRLDRFDWVQSALVMVVGFGGAMFVARRTGSHEVVLGISAVVLAVALYVLAFTVLHRERRRCFQYLTATAITLVLAASASLLPRPVLPWAVLAIATAFTARHFGRVTMGTHAGIYALAATLASGVLPEALDGWTALTGGRPTSPDGWLAAGTLLVVGAVRVLSTREANVRTGDATRALVLLVFVAVGGGLLMRAATAFPPGDLADGGWSAASRTVVLAVFTLACAALGRRTGYRTLGHLTPVLLGIGALKLLFEDVALGRPVSLALSFSAYGAALILAPRLLRRRSPEA